jgi:hypothetical protein
MMHTSLLQDRVDQAWPNITERVEKALKFKNGTLIRDVIPVTARTSGHGRWGGWQAGPGNARYRAADSPPEVIATEHRLKIDYDTLEPPLDDLLDGIETWATAARTHELIDLLKYLGDHAKPVQLDTSPEEIVPAGWGEPRFVHSGLPPADLEQLAAVAEEQRITVPLAAHAKAFVFRMSGGLSMNVGPDMSLGWIPSVDGIELVLVTQTTLINAEPAHITKVT